jgi:hypothetical protein
MLFNGAEPGLEEGITLEEAQVDCPYTARAAPIPWKRRPTFSSGLIAGGMPLNIYRQVRRRLPNLKAEV